MVEHVNPFVVCGQRGQQKRRLCAPSLLVFPPASGVVCLCVCVIFVCDESVCVWWIHTNHPSVGRLGSDDALSSPCWSRHSNPGSSALPSAFGRGRGWICRPARFLIILGGRKRSRWTPPILRETFAQASLIGKRKDTRTSEHSLSHGALCTARDRARGW